jgi:hypothetical protein
VCQYSITQVKTQLHETFFAKFCNFFFIFLTIFSLFFGQKAWTPFVTNLPEI